MPFVRVVRPTFSRGSWGKSHRGVGQQVVIDNRPGANGVLAADMTAKGTPDGHTLLFVAIGHAINPLLQKNLPYDTQKDSRP